MSATIGSLILEKLGVAPEKPQQEAPEIELLAAAAPAPGEPPELQRRQNLALVALASGLGVTAAARPAEVSRQTVYNWMREAPFSRALRAWRFRTAESVHDRLLAAADQAAQCIVHSIKSNNPAVAMSLLKGMGLLKDKKE